nr:GPN-loop GTPase 2 [Odocoileus virginianus texanus]
MVGKPPERSLQGPQVGPTPRRHHLGLISTALGAKLCRHREGGTSSPGRVFPTSSGSRVQVPSVPGHLIPSQRAGSFLFLRRTPGIASSAGGSARWGNPVVALRARLRCGSRLPPLTRSAAPHGAVCRPPMAGAAPTTAFGQAVIGPPGSGKTTYCLGMSEFLRALGRHVAVVNLDPANEGLPYECAVDVGELVGLGDVMDALQLGPNGGLLYCMEYLEANLDWLRAKLDPLRGHYFLFDCPGQVELCTHHGALRSIFSQMTQWDLRLTAVHLVDSHYCTDPAKFISVLCTSLATMLHVELPHVNLLSKMDLIEHYGKLAFNLDYYTEVLDLSYLLDHLASDPFFRHYRQLNEKLVQLIEDYSLVSFIPLNIQDKESIQRVLQAVDKANGYCFGVQEQRSLEAMMSAAMGADFHFSSTLGLQEKYLEPSEQSVEQEAMQL